MCYKPLIFLFTAFLLNIQAQVTPFEENKKWGLKENEKTLVAAVYDTLFNFDKSGQVCLVCFKSKSTNTNKFIKVTNTNYYCNYLNKESKRLVLRTGDKDTCSVFQLGKQTVKQYNDNDTLMKVTVKNSRYLVKKNFQQLTYKPYYDIDLCDDPGFYVAQEMSEAEVPMFGLVNSKEEVILPFEYTGIKLNPSDSLVMVCGAGYRNGTEDHVFNYKGKKISSFRHHVDLATKDFVIFKLFDPKEHYLVYSLEDKTEREIAADEVKFYKGNQICLRQKTTWWIYDLKTQQKTEFKKEP